MKKGILLLALVLTFGLASTCFAPRGGRGDRGGMRGGRVGRMGGFRGGRFRRAGGYRPGPWRGPAWGVSVGVPLGYSLDDPYCCWRCRRYGWCPYHSCEYCP